MNKKEFSVLTQSIKQILSECDATITRYQNFSNGNGSIKKYNAAVRTARNELLPKLDKIATNEVYHIIGMADLTDQQTVEFYKCIREVLSKRIMIRIISRAVEITLEKLEVKGSYESILLKKTLKK